MLQAVSRRVQCSEYSARSSLSRRICGLNYVGSLKMSIALNNLKYRVFPLPEGHLESLGIKPNSSAALFFSQYSGPFFSSNTGFTLLEIGGEDLRESIDFSTKIVQEKFAWPKRYLVISDLVANSVLVYDTISEGVFNVDFEGGDSMLLQGKLPADFVSFQAFLEWFFAGGC